jgi:hypothetical protein
LIWADSLSRHRAGAPSPNVATPWRFRRATRIACWKPIACLRVACGALSATWIHFTTRRSGPVRSRLVAATTSCRPNSVASMLIVVSGGRRGPGSRYSAKTRRASSTASRTNLRSDTTSTPQQKPSITGRADSFRRWHDVMALRAGSHAGGFLRLLHVAE